MKTTAKKIISMVLVLCMLLSPFAGLSIPASAKTEGTISAPTVTAYLIGKDGEKVQLVQWFSSGDDDTYYDAEGVEMPGVVSASGVDNFRDGTTQDYLLYTGSDNGDFARTIVVTKYVPLETLAEAAAAEAGLIYDSATWNIEMKSGDTWTTYYGNYTTQSKYVSSSQIFYSSFNWLLDCFSNASGSNKSTGKLFSTAAYPDAREVPAILGLCNWNCRLSALAADSGVPLTNVDSIKAALSAIAGKTDMANSLRFVYGMDVNSSTTKYINTGANSEKGVADITLYPVYHPVSITDGSAAGTEGENGFGYSISHAAVTSGDNWFKAANGETVALTVRPENGYIVDSMVVSSGSGSITVTPDTGNTYKFTMPDGPVTVSINTDKEPGNPDALVWDGTLDFRWYDAANPQAEYHITTPAQWAALAWICSEHLGDLTNYEQKTNGNVKDIFGTIPAVQNTFENVKFYLDNNIDMGGIYDAGAKTWSGPNYYPVGSQALNDPGSGSFFGLFNGSFDGQGHIISNIYCNRGTGQNWQSAGLFGRVGAADNTPAPACDIVIENVAISGYIKSGRSVGGIVGKTLHVAEGHSVTVRNCLNFADITSSDAKGTGGIVGAGWNRPISIDNCANFGTVIANYKNGGGISGSFEGTSDNCYNVGDISKSAANNGQSFGTNNGGALANNFYWLTGTSNTVGANAAIYNPTPGSTTYEITDNYQESGLSAQEYMKSEAFLTALNNGGETWNFALNSDPIYKKMDSMGLAGYPVPTVFAPLLGKVEFTLSPANATVALSDSESNLIQPNSDGTYTLERGKTYTYTVSAKGCVTQQATFTADVFHKFNIDLQTDWITLTFNTTPVNAAVVIKHGDETILPNADGSYRLIKGEIYTYKVSAEGYVMQNGSFLAEEGGTIPIVLIAAGGTGHPGTGNVNATVWDGKSIDVSWYDPKESVYYIGTPAQLAGLAAIVNGIYNKEIDTFAGSARYIVNNIGEVSSSGSGGLNKSTDAYHYGADDFNGKTVYLTADIDMSKGNYMPIGGQYLMTRDDADTKLGSSFCGVLDGQGHSVTIQCDRYCSTGNYGDGQSVGLIGRLGVHDNDPESLQPSGAGVRNLAVYGSVYANRSVGGIVGKIGKTDGGAVIENCANFADVRGTDAKGTGGIVGAAWNGGEIRNCYNAGAINNTHNAYAGIAGSNEISLVNCYNIGKVTGAGKSAAIASENGGGSYQNCYWLEGTADMGVYNKALDGVAMKTAAQMKEDAFLNALGSAFAKDTRNKNKGYPVLAWQNTSAPTGTGGSTSETAASVTIESTTTVTNGKAATAVTEKAVTAGIEAAAKAGGKSLIIRTDTKGRSAASTTVSVPKASAQEITKAALDLTLQTADNSRVTLTPATLTSITGQAGGSTLEITVTSETKQVAADIVSAAKNLDSKNIDLENDLVISVTIKSGGKEISSFTGSMTIDLPVDSAKYTEGQSYKVIQISADGSVETLTGACVKVNGILYVRVSVSHLSTFIVTAAKAFAGYDDVKPGAWYYDAVAYITEKGLMGSTGGNRFLPETNMTRAMLVTVLYRLDGSPAVSTDSSFTDVPTGQWYTDAVKWASANKIIDGYGNGLFGTNDSVTRQQIAAILYRYGALKNYDTAKKADLTAYTDVSEIADWAQDGIAWANAAGLITGRTETTLAPGGTASRAEVATMLMRFCENIAK